MHKRDEIIAAIKKCAERLGRAPSQAEFRRASKISWYQVYKHFRGMRQAVRAAGLEPGPRGGALDVNALTLDWARVVRKLGRLPSRAEYSEHGIHHAGTLHARIVWSQMAHKFVLLVREFHLEREWADVVKIVVGKFPLLEQQATSNWQKPFTAEDAQPPHQAKTGLAGGPGGAKEEERETYHEGTETRRAAEIEDNLGRSLAVKAPLDFDRSGMRLGKVVAAALAIEILMAAERSSQQTALRSTQQSALSSQPSNWQSANGNWQEQDHDQTQDQNKEQSLEIQSAHDRLSFDELSAAQGTLRNTEEAGTLVHEHGACAGGQAPCGRPVVYGEPLGLAAMAHAPTNELGVLFLFGIVAADLGFRVERLQAAFPDCEAKREVAPGKWELVFIELEIYSRNFKLHRHNPRGCHAIVCWKHNWPDCPEWLEVIELSKVVKRLGDREIG
jgi:Homing endonuclease associated repeat